MAAGPGAYVDAARGRAIAVSPRGSYEPAPARTLTAVRAPASTWWISATSR